MKISGAEQMVDSCSGWLAISTVYPYSCTNSYCWVRRSLVVLVIGFEPLLLLNGGQPIHEEEWLKW